MSLFEKRALIQTSQPLSILDNVLGLGEVADFGASRLSRDQYTIPIAIGIDAR